MFKTALLIISLPFSLFASDLCSIQETEVQCPALLITQDSQASEMTVVFNDGFEMALQVSNTEQSPSLHFSYDLGERLTPELTPSDIGKIATAVAVLNTQEQSSHFKLLRFFQQLPAGENLDSLTQDPTGEVPWPSDGSSTDDGEDDDGDSGEVPWPEQQASTSHKKKHFIA